MRQVSFACVALFFLGAQGAPRYLVVPIEDVEFLPSSYGPPRFASYPMMPQEQLSRHARSAYPEPYPQLPEEVGEALQAVERTPIYRPGSNRRSGPPGPPPPVAEARGPEGAIPVFQIPAEIRQAEDAIASGSSDYARTSHGPDYVDYGAYTGGHGAFEMRKRIEASISNFRQAF